VTKRHTAKKPAHEAPIRPLRSEADYNKALAEIERYFHVEPKPGTSAADRFDLLALVIADYEDKRWPIEPPDPIQAIRWRMETAGYTQTDLSDRLAAARVGYSIPQAAPYDGHGMEAPSQVGHSRRSADSSAAEVKAAIHHRGGIARAARRRTGLVQSGVRSN
jgi:antitoxin component HigA of HigAB toxin-antitoxin module